MPVTLSFRDEALRRFGDDLDALGANAPKAVSRAMNHSGRKARTQVMRALTRQTGLPRKVITRAVREWRASPDDMAYVLSAQGGRIALKYFRARETRRGVTAYPYGQRTVYPGAFIRGGRRPNRKALNMGGHVFVNTAYPAWRGEIEKQRTRIRLPDELVKGETQAAWERVVETDLMPRLEHEINRLAPGR